MAQSLCSRRGLLKSSLMGAAAAGLAGAGISGEAQAAATKASKKNQYDVLVVGAGCAGLVTAIRAHDLGAKVAVLEKMDRPDGNAIYALGSVCAWGTRHQKAQGLEDTAEDFYKAMMQVSAGRADPDLTKVYTDNITAGVDWLEQDIKVPFGKIRKAPWPRLGRTCRVLGEGITGGANLVQHLLAAAEARKIDILYEHKAVKLLTDKHLAVTGVEVLSDNGLEEFYAKGGVVICSGGFSANPEMTDRYIGGWASRLAIRGSRSTTGENVSLCLPVFAKMVNMDQFHAGPIVAATHVNPADVLNSGYGIIVDLRGKRFVDEKNTYVIKAKACAQLTIENKAFAIVDSQCNVLDRVIPKFDALHNPYGKADTLEALCKQVGLPFDAVNASVQEYNDAVEKKTLKQLNPSNSYPKPFKIEKGPFYAVPYEGGMTATFGGPLINVRAEVQSLDRQSIPGLYAAGNAAGGLFFRDYMGGAQLGAATVFGTIAAQQAVARAKRA